MVEAVVDVVDDEWTARATVPRLRRAAPDVRHGPAVDNVGLGLIGLIVTAVTYFYNPLTPLLIIALVLLGLVLFSMMSTRLETAPAPPRRIPMEAIPPPRNEHPR